MFSGRLWMGSYWEPNPTPCARRWGPSVPGTPGAPDAPRAPRAATYLVICVGPASTFPCKKTIQSARGAHKYDPICCPEVYFVLFFARESARRDNKYDQICCSDVYFVLFFARESVRVAHAYDPVCCPEVYFVWFFARESARVVHTYDPRCCPEVYFVLFFDREGGGGLAWGWHGSWLAPGRLGEGVFINREQ